MSLKTTASSVNSFLRLNLSYRALVVSLCWPFRSFRGRALRAVSFPDGKRAQLTGNFWQLAGSSKTLMKLASRVMQTETLLPKTPARHQHLVSAHCHAFTLIELLGVIAIVAILAGLLIPALGRAKLKSRMINEMNSARQIILAWQMYTHDYEDRVLPGYRYDFPAYDRLGNSLEHPINARYPWRLAPYLAHNFEVLYANRNRELLHEFANNDNVRYTYAASLFPSLGANSIFVGGDDLVLPPTAKAFAKFGRFCVLRASDARHPSRLIAFTSARSRFNGKPVDGFYRMEPPYLLQRIWQEDYSEESAPETFGFVHPRYSGRSVAAVFDGHAEVLGLREIQDMRRWCDLADRPDWTLAGATQ